MIFPISPKILNILLAIKKAGGTSYLVGGSVRNHFLGILPRDLDIEVYGLSLASLEALLSKYGRVSKVGMSFGVIILSIDGELPTEFTLPRRDNKQGRGHKDFYIQVDPSMTLQEAASRRDFTINTMSYDPITNILYDPFQGAQDLSQHILRHVSDAYGEDPLRVLRGFQFISRFDLTPELETILKSRELVKEYDTLSVERIWMEWWKWAVQGKNLAAGLKWLVDTEWISFYPELKNLIDLEQDPIWHAQEKDVFEHTGLVLNKAVFIADREKLSDKERAILIFVALCHDMGKVTTTSRNEKGRIVSPGHAEISSVLAYGFLNSIGAPGWLIGEVIPLTREHMARPSTFRGVRRLAKRLEPSSIRTLALLMEADKTSRSTVFLSLPGFVTKLVTMAEEIKILDNAPKPVLMGRHLIDMGMPPGKIFSPILKTAYEAQLDGFFKDLTGAKAWLTQDILIQILEKERY